MAKQKPIRAHKYLDNSEIIEHLSNVEYIIMATPNPDALSKHPIHFTIFLNTSEELPFEAKDAVLDQFCEQYQISSKDAVISQLAKVGFAQTDEETLMPMHLFKPEAQKEIPNVSLHLIDFIGDAQGFDEVKTDGHTGWSYSYN
ncbi:MAG: hypothetical protein U9R50_11980 [Campylobacterota bacterium]|nr:hypothetical protein [Campylobacterota bacterium]